MCFIKYPTIHSLKMSTSEKFCLKWNDFQQNVCKTFLQLRQQTELFDVKYRILQLSEEYLDTHAAAHAHCL